MRKLFLILTAFIGLAGCTRPASSIVQDSARSAGSRGGYELKRSASLVGTGCPFIKEELNFNALMGQIKGHLEAKEAGNELCEAGQRALEQNLTAIRNYYTNANSPYGAQQEVDEYRNYLNDLQIRLEEKTSTAGPNDNEVLLLQQAMVNAETQMRLLSATMARQRTDSDFQNKQVYRRELFLHLNDSIVNLENMDAKCVRKVGGWKQVLSPILSAASLASGFSFFEGQSLVGAGLQIAGSLVRLFTKDDAKKALRELVEAENRKVLACTYYSIQHSACEIKRGLDLLDKNRKRLGEKTESANNKNVPEDWQSHLRALARIALLDGIFDTIARQGSTLSLDETELSKYYSSLRLLSDEVKDLGPNPTDLDKQRWLSNVRRFGVVSSDKTAFGDPLSLDEQVKRAQTEIANARGQVGSVEANLRQNKSFEALKHELIAKAPQVIPIAAKTRDYLRREALKLSEHERGALFVSAELLDATEKFMNVGLTASEDTPAYLDRISDAGMKLFAAISYGSVAQATKQQILALGIKSSERLLYALQTIENKWVQDDLVNKTPFEKTFLAYKQEAMLLYRLDEIAPQLEGNGEIGRDDDIQTAYRTFEGGFEDELVDMIDHALKLESSHVPSLQNATASHYCSLFSSFMRGAGKKGQKLLVQCQARFSTLPIKTRSYSGLETIDYADSCFYNSYQRKVQSFERMDKVKRDLIDVNETTYR